MDSWRARAACRGMDTGTFFDPARTAEALAVCARCPVREPCLDAALAAEGSGPPGRAHRHGVVGGLRPGERFAITRGPVQAAS